MPTLRDRITKLSWISATLTSCLLGAVLPGSEIDIVGPLTFHQLALIIAAASTLVAIVMSLYLIMMHATHYTGPREQKQLVFVCAKKIPAKAIPLGRPLLYGGNDWEYCTNMPALITASSASSSWSPYTPPPPSSPYDSTGTPSTSRSLATATRPLRFPPSSLYYATTSPPTCTSRKSTSASCSRSRAGCGPSTGSRRAAAAREVPGGPPRAA